MKETMDLKFKELYVGINELVNLLSEIKESEHSSDKLVVNCIVCNLQVEMTLYTPELHERMMDHGFNAKDRELYSYQLDHEILEVSNYIKQLKEYLKLDVWQRDLSSFQAVKKYYDDMKRKCPEAHDEAIEGLINNNETIKFFFKMNK